MANVQLPATGAGTADIKVAVEVIATENYQLIKLVDATATSTTPTGTTANPLQIALPAATVTTLTPPAAITGFATSAKQLADGHSVALSATDNAVLDDLATKLGTIDTAIDAINAKLVTGTVIGDVNLGATDNAVLDEINAHVHNVDTKLATGTVIGDVNLGATDNAVLDTMVTALQIIDNMIAGNEAQVDIVSGTVTTVSTLTGGGVAHDAADSGNPIKIGFKVESTPSAQVCADADRTDGIADMDGAQFVREGCTLGDCLYESVSNTNGSATASAVFTTGAGVRNVITDITVYNASATAGFIIFTDGSGGTTMWTMPLPAGGGATHAFRTPLRTSANVALYFDVSGALTTVYISLSGYRSKVT
jgi:hypothetical protein